MNVSSIKRAEKKCKYKMDVFEGIFEQIKDEMEDSLLEELIQETSHFNNNVFHKKLISELNKRKKSII